MRDLSTLPKAHLHLHLEGAMRPSTLEALAGKYHLEVPAIRGFGSFAAFAATYLAACEVLVSFDDLRRLVWEVVEDAALAGAVWVEPSTYIPHHRLRLGPDQAVLDVILDAMTEAATAHGIGGGFMVSADRTIDPTDAVEQAKLAVANRTGAWCHSAWPTTSPVSRPSRSPPRSRSPVTPACCRPRMRGSWPDRRAWWPPSTTWGRTGSSTASGPSRTRIWSAGWPIRRCASTCARRRTSCCRSFPSLEDHPLPALLEAGVRCSVNGDDPLLFGPNLLEEYELCRNSLKLSDDQLAVVARCSIEASGAPDAVKREGWPASTAGWPSPPRPTAEAGRPR